MLLVAALAIIFVVQRQKHHKQIKDERQRMYQHRQRMLSESSDHEKSIIFHRSEKDELNDDGNDFDDISGSHVIPGGIELTQDVGTPVDDLASMEVNYTSLVNRLVLQLKALAESNVELAQKHGVDPVSDVDPVIQSDNPTALFEKIREVKQANLSLSRDESRDEKPVVTAVKRKPSRSKPNSASVVPVDLSQHTVDQI